MADLSASIVAWTAMVFVAAIVLVAASLGARAQDVMRHLDFSSPAMTEAELGRAMIEALIAAGEPLDFTKRSLNGVDFTGLDLRGADFRWSRLNGADFSDAKLDDADLSLSWGVGAAFDRASMRGAKLFQAQLIEASFIDADLEGARLVGNFTKARFDRADLRDARMDVDMRNQSMGLTRAVLRSARVDGAVLAGADLFKADLEFAKLRGADLSGARFEDVKLGGADLSGARVAGLDLTGGDLDSATLKELEGVDALVGLDAARHLRRACTDW